MPKGKPRSMNYHCHKIRVGDAGHKGRGVFARGAISSGEAVEVAPTLIIPRAEVEAVTATFLSNYSFAHDNVDIIGLGYISLYNHSFTPNSTFTFARATGAMLIVALRAIAEGEEVTIDYGWPDEAFRAAGITGQA